MKLILISLLFGLCQCGYNWGHHTRELPGGHKTVYVEMFDNQTKEVGLEAQLTHSLIQELERSGFALVTSKHNAEIIIQGSVLSAAVIGSGSSPNFVAKNFSSATPSERTSTNYTASFFTSYSVTIVANLKAVRSRDEQTIWQTSVRGLKSFQGARLKKQGVRSSNVLYNQARKKQTIKLIAREMMSDAFDRLTENF